jgi:hypothetical protein
MSFGEWVENGSKQRRASEREGQDGHGDGERDLQEIARAWTHGDDVRAQMIERGAAWPR